MNARVPTLLLLAFVMFAGHATAASDSLVTVGVGAQYGFVSGSVSDVNRDAPEHQYGLVGRLKLLRFVGLEVATQFDHEPNSQSERLLSPRYQVGLMANLPTQYLCAFVVGGIGAHGGGDLVDPSGETTSFHLGGGVEVFVGEHVAIGGDLRYRVPGVHEVSERVQGGGGGGTSGPGLDGVSTQTWGIHDGSSHATGSQGVSEAGFFDVWQLNFTISYYL